MWYRLKKALKETGERTENPKNCPFCSGAAKLITGNEPEWSVLCLNDPCSFSGPYRKDSQGAIAAWNRIVLK